MALYVTVLSGPSAETAEPIVATSDRRVVQAVLRAIARLGGIDAEGGPGRARPPAALHLVGEAAPVVEVRP